MALCAPGPREIAITTEANQNDPVQWDDKTPPEVELTERIANPTILYVNQESSTVALKHYIIITFYSFQVAHNPQLDMFSWRYNKKTTPKQSHVSAIILFADGEASTSEGLVAAVLLYRTIQKTLIQ